MEDVLAATHLDAGLLTQAFDHADATVVILTVVVQHLDSSSLVVLLDAVFVQTWQTLLLSFEASAPVTARQSFIAAALLVLETFFAVTAGLECWVFVF